MYFEDFQSNMVRTFENNEGFYELGQREMISKICKEIHRKTGISLPSSFDEFIKKTVSIFSGKNNTNTNFSIECDSNILYKILNDTEKLIRQYEEGIKSQGKIKIQDFRFFIKIVKNDYIQAEKQQIASYFSEAHDLSVNESIQQYIISLQKQLEEFRNPDFSDFYELYNEITDFHDDFEIKNFESELSAEEIALLKFQKHQKSLINEKEWEKQEALMMKEKYKSKKKNLNKRKKELSDLETSLKKKNLEVEKEKHELERLKDNYYREKKKIALAFESKAKKITEVITDLSENFENYDNIGKSSPITETDIISDISMISDTDRSFESFTQEIDSASLTKRINDLESQYKTMTVPQVQEKLKTEIDSLKNSLTKLRASNAIKNSLINQKNYTLRSNFHSFAEQGGNLSKYNYQNYKVLTPRIKHMNTLNPDYLRNIKSGRTTPRTDSKFFDFNESFTKNYDSESIELKKFLRLQETRLKDREDQLNIEKDHIIEKWAEIPVAKDVIPFLQKEILEFKKKNFELQKKIKDFDYKELNLNSKFEELNNQEYELNIRNREINDFKDRLDDEKIFVINKLIRLRDEIERS